MLLNSIRRFYELGFFFSLFFIKTCICLTFFIRYRSKNFSVPLVIRKPVLADTCTTYNEKNVTQIVICFCFVFSLYNEFFLLILLIRADSLDVHVLKIQVKEKYLISRAVLNFISSTHCISKYLKITPIPV